MHKSPHYSDWLEYLNWIDKYNFFSKKKDGIIYLFSSFSTIILSIILLFSGLILFPILSIFLSILKLIYFKYFLYDEFKNNNIEDSSQFNYGLNIIFYFVALIITAIFFIIYFIIIYFYQYYKLKNNNSKICFKIQFIIVLIEILFGTLFTVLSQKIIEKYYRNYILKNEVEDDDKIEKNVDIK